MSTNPYESPPVIEREITGPPTTLTWRRVLADVTAGLFVGATYGSFGGACVSALRMLFFGAPTSVFQRVEQTVMAAVFGAFGGAVIGLCSGAVLALVVGVLFRYLRLERSVGFYWGSITLSAMAGSLAGFSGGFVMAQSSLSDPTSMVWYPIGAVVGGMIGAMAGRQWIRLVAGQQVSPFKL